MKCLVSSKYPRHKKSLFHRYKLSVLLAIFILASSAYAENYNDRFIAEDAAVIAFTNARVIDGTGGKAKEKQTVIIRDGRITQMGRSDKISIPKEAKAISLMGKSLLPGWVMTHEHLFYGTHPGEFSPTLHNFVVTQQSISYPRLYLAAGVTSARTTGSIQPYSELQIKKQISAGTMVGPDFELTAPYIEGEAGPAYLFMSPQETAKQARDTVSYWADQGFTSFKNINLNHKQLDAVLKEANKRGLKVTSHPLPLTDYERAIDVGLGHIEHGFVTIDESGVGLPPGHPKVQGMMEYFIDHGVGITATLAIYDVKPTPEPVLDLLTDYSRKDYTANRWALASKSMAKRILKTQQNLTTAFWQKGGHVTVGADPAVQGMIAGYANLRAIELLVEGGIPNLEVIKMATLNGAFTIGIEKERGTIEIGKRADLLVMKGDPSADIKAIYNIETVFKNGIGYDPMALKESVKGAVGGPG